jgi:hypothetical protein
MSEYSEQKIQINVPEILIGEFNISKCFVDSIKNTGTPINNADQFMKRLKKSEFLIRALFEKMDEMGENQVPMIAEIGVWRGLSARVMADAIRHRVPSWTGETMHLVDGFKGLATPSSEDLIEGSEGLKHSYLESTNHRSGPEIVASALQDCPNVKIFEGLVPEILASLPDKAWGFVHIDTDHYMPTLECMKYFVPRMLKGGVIMDDDYSSAFFPGPRKAWDQYAMSENLEFTITEAGQSLAKIH